MELKAEDRELLKSAIKAAERVGANPTRISEIAQGGANPPPQPTQHEDKHKAHESVDDLLNCPNCGGAVRAKIYEEIKKKPFKCVDCGFPVGEDEESCPLCGGKDAKER